jgi:hypothetical protein
MPQDTSHECITLTACDVLTANLSFTGVHLPPPSPSMRPPASSAGPGVPSTAAAPALARQAPENKVSHPDDEEGQRRALSFLGSFAFPFRPNAAALLSRHGSSPCPAWLMSDTLLCLVQQEGLMPPGVLPGQPTHDVLRST